jgi:hypothetical protein
VLPSPISDVASSHKDSLILSVCITSGPKLNIFSCYQKMSVKVVARAIGAVPDKDVGAGICVFACVRVCACVFVCACLPRCAVRCGIFESCFLYIYMLSMILSTMKIRRHEPQGMHARSHKMHAPTHRRAQSSTPKHGMTTHRMYTICIKLTDALLAQ